MVLYGGASDVYRGLKRAVEAATAIFAAGQKLGSALNDLAAAYQQAASKPDTAPLDAAMAEVRTACGR